MFDPADLQALADLVTHHPWLSVPAGDRNRLRECDYGELNGTPAAELHELRAAHLDVPHPGGESWRQAVGRNARVLADLPLRCIGRRVLIIGHGAPPLGPGPRRRRHALEDLIGSDFGWREGWEYRLP